MSIGEAVFILRVAIEYILIIATPVLLVGIGVGLIIAIFQAVTSIQEQTLSFVPKIIAILLMVFFISPWIAAKMIELTMVLFQRISTL